MIGPLRNPKGPWVVVAALIAGLAGGAAAGVFAGLYDLTHGDGFGFDSRLFFSGLAGGIVVFIVIRTIAQSRDYPE